MKKEYDNKKQRVKLMLLDGKRLTVRELDKKLSTNNSPEIIRRLRKEMDVQMVWKTSSSGTRYGEYFYVPEKKESRIQNREYIKH